MAVLGLPATFVIDQHAVAAFAALNARPRGLIGEGDILHAVTHVADDTRRARHHRHPLRHHAQIADGEIHSVVAVIGPLSAFEITSLTGGVHVHVIGHPAGFAE